MSQFDEDFKKLQDYKNTSQVEKKDALYEELLADYKKAKDRITELEQKLAENKTKLPSRDEVETMSSMIDLISKLDESTIEKLSRFGNK